jgi:ribosome biogenesis protein Nip4
MVILYVETNFLMGIAKGQDPQAEDLLLQTLTSVSLAVPSICYVEALTTLEQEEKYNKDFIGRLDIQINEADRDKNSENAQLLLSLLNQSKVQFLERINVIKERFYIAFNQLSNEAEIITLNPAMIQESLERNILQKHLIDKLILECIIHHARLHVSETKVFLSSNSKEFGKREVIEILQHSGIQYFNKTQNFLGWLQSQLL